MPSAVLELLVAAAEFLPIATPQKPKSYATWCETCHDSQFEVESTIRYLRRKRIECDELLLHQYAQTHANHTAFDLRRITKIAPWIDRLDDSFVNYASIRKLHKASCHVGIITFTTPAISKTGDVGFLEVWTEDGRKPQMGSARWLQLRRKQDRWTLDWMHMFRIS